jgi:ribonuclease P protein component
MSGGQNNLGSQVNMRRLRLPRTAILRGEKAFARLFKSGKVMRSPLVDFRFILQPDVQQPSTVAFIASKRLGNAVKRNYCKRMMRESYRLNKPLFDVALMQYGGCLQGALIAKRSDIQLEELQIILQQFAQKLSDEIKRSVQGSQR